MRPRASPDLRAAAAKTKMARHFPETPMTSLTRPTLPTRLLAAGAMLAAIALGGCSAKEEFPPACPSLALLADAADLSSYSPRGRDLTDLVLDARIVTVPATCQRGERGFVDTLLRVTADLVRGPAAPDGNVNVPVFVAVTDNGVVLDKQDFRLVGAFPTNVDRMRLSTPDIVLNLPVTRDKSAAAYKIYIGFILTPEQLELNRSRGPR
jgi:hypothetical protein